jgi:predicted DNA-binding transcriptional regulator AlpA
MSALAFSTVELAEILDKSKSTITKLAREGSDRIPPARRVGHYWYFDQIAVQKWLEKNK